jgi:hypothetical protein
MSQVFFAKTETGVELPVLDITLPLFAASIDETKLDALGKEAIERARSLTKNPVAKFLAGRSLTLGQFRPDDQNASYISGMSTLMMKLGPKLIKGGVNRFMDRKVAAGFTGVTVRMRLRDICRLQKEALIPKLQGSPQKNLCFVNIAGGAATDSINTLILLQKENSNLLKSRSIEINVLDIDTFGPHFASQSINELKKNGGCFCGLDLTFNQIQYHWSNTENLDDLLTRRRDWIVVFVSEGGLFEYGTDDDIIQNLNSLYNYSTDDALVVGDFVLDLDRVNPAFPALLEGSGNVIRFIGEAGFKKILKNTTWILDRTIEGNPCYTIFTLKKKD